MAGLGGDTLTAPRQTAPELPWSCLRGQALARQRERCVTQPSARDGLFPGIQSHRKAVPRRGGADRATPPPLGGWHP